MDDRLKTLLGDELFNQIKGKLGDKTLTLADPAAAPTAPTGEPGKIPLSRFNEVNGRKNELEAQVTMLTGLLKSLTDEKNASTAAAAKAALDAKVNDLIAKSGAKKAEIVRALLGVEVQDTPECMTQIQTRLDALKQSDPYLFDGNKVTGNTPANTNITAAGSVSKEDFKKMSYSERAALYARDKALYDSVKS